MLKKMTRAEFEYKSQFMPDTYASNNTTNEDFEDYVEAAYLFSLKWNPNVKEWQE